MNNEQLHKNEEQFPQIVVQYFKDLGEASAIILKFYADMGEEDGHPVDLEDTQPSSPVIPQTGTEKK